MSRDLRTFVQLLRAYRWRYVLGALALVVSDGGQLLIADATGGAIDALGARPPGAVAPFAIAIAGFGIAIVVARFVWRHLIFGSSRRIERDLRQRLFDHLQSQSPSFFLDRKVGELMAYATNDVAAIQVAAASGMLAGFDAVIQSVLATSMMVVMVSPSLALVSLLPLLLLPPATYWLGRRLHEHFGAVQEGFSHLSDRVQESVAGVRVIKGYVREEHERARFAEVNEAYLARYRRMLRYDVAFDPLIGVLAGTSFAIALAYGGAKVVASEITLGEYIAFNTYLAMLVWPMLALGWTMNLFQRAAASGRRLEDLFAVEPAIRDAADAEPLADPRGHLRLVDLTFAYGPGLAPALRHVALDLPPGRTVGIVGRTGSGKSTLAQVVLRLFEPPAGHVFLDGRDVTRLRLADLRRAIAYVPQDTFLFSRSVADNIAFDPAEHTRAEVLAAAAAADLDRDVAAFPDGYDTAVGERGITLSGGQRQRVGLARALLRRAPLLVLDDCLSAVDTATEARIVSSLRAESTRRSVVIVSHRVSAVRHADEILVLGDGAVVERGTHDELVGLGGEYAWLYRRQQLEESIEETE